MKLSERAVAGRPSPSGPIDNNVTRGGWIRKGKESGNQILKVYFSFGLRKDPPFCVTMSGNPFRIIWLPLCAPIVWGWVQGETERDTSKRKRICKYAKGEAKCGCVINSITWQANKFQRFSFYSSPISHAPFELNTHPHPPNDSLLLHHVTHQQEPDPWTGRSIIDS